MLSIDDIIEIKNSIKSCMEDIIDVLLLQSGEVTSSKGLIKEQNSMQSAFKQTTSILEKNGVVDSIMNQINAEGYMTHQRIEQIVSYALGDEYKLRQYLQQARVAEMKMQLNMKKLEGEIELLKVHNRQFECRLETL